MKFQVISTGLLSATALLSGVSASSAPAQAQCVMTDVSVQAAIHGSKYPAEQVNNVNMQAPGGCVGNAITQTNTQVYAGSADRVRQIRNSNQVVMTGNLGNSTGVAGPTIKVPVGVKVNVYNPAYDPNFKPGLTP